MDQTSFPVDQPADAALSSASLPASRVQSWARIAARLGAVADIPAQYPPAAA